ncbi:tetratricopeptide (TPR) repeat protein [Catalinimonas alkaloidigena]|uniref:tetratricopeptide repeat protein n=1 Tax=Catalinimonas alkaloidigena TaxID=1075417 RepID=UPI0024064D44|nr:tetratricopeptide repeat protein [Catalinimonas alkaloidigena]MDF9797653.1 tetratricopeptide (TPR) repeat protein [Catalinimonas alkaloidigena]
MIKLSPFLLIVCVLCSCGSSSTDQESTITVKKDVEDTLLTSEKVVEAISLLGDTLYRLDLPQERKAQYDSALRVALQNYNDAPRNLENIIWLGRRQAYLGRYQEAIDTYTNGLTLFPDSPELYRHRGHRYISTRQFDKAIADLEKSAQLVKSTPLTDEANGIPLPLPEDDQPTTLQFNIYYHLGLAYYLEGEYGKAAQTYEKCLEFCQTDDEITATADWLYMAYRRLGEDEVAEETLAMIREDMDIRENEGYFERLLMYKGLVSPDSLLEIGPNVPLADRDLALATQGYGVGNFYLYNGEQQLAKQILEDIIEGRHWAAFGYIAAEADLARMQE